MTQQSGRREVREEEHLGQVVDGDGEEENHGAVEEQFGQTDQRASRLQTGLQRECCT